MAISGNVTTEAGVAADLVRIFRWPDNVLETTAVPDAAGDWMAEVAGTGEYGITYIADGCQPITHGPYYIERTRWTPVNMTLDLWLDAEDLDSVTVGGGSAVTLWADKSGNGRDAVGSGGSAPTLDGLMIDFNGSQYLSISGGAPVSPEVTVFEVFLRPGNSSLIVPLGGAIASEPPYATYWDGTTIYSGLGSSSYRTHGTSTKTGIVVHSLRRDATTVQLWQDGSALGDVLSPMPGVSEFSYVGRRGPNYTTGKIAELIVAPADMSTADRQKMEGYLAWKWGVVSELPATHPYKTARPS